VIQHDGIFFWRLLHNKLLLFHSRIEQWKMFDKHLILFYVYAQWRGRPPPRLEKFRANSVFRASSSFSKIMKDKK